MEERNAPAPESETSQTTETPVTPVAGRKSGLKYKLIGLLIVMVLVAFVSWLLWARKDKSIPEPQLDSEEQVIPEREAPSVIDDTNYIEIADLGIKIDPGDLTDLTVSARQFEGGGGYYLYFSTKQLENLEKQTTGKTTNDDLFCQAEDGAIGATSLYEAQTEYQEPGDNTGQPAKDVLPQIAGTIYYGGTVGQPQAYCSEDPAVVQLQTELIDKISSIKILAL